MATPKTPLPEPVDLGRFEGRKVTSARMTITKTGDGLSDAMHVDPVKLHLGDEVFVIIKGVVADVRHPANKDDNGAARLHVVRAVEATIIDADLAEPQLSEQRERIAKAIEAEEVAAGRPPLIPREDTVG
jgi:hypothetical protein